MSEINKNEESEITSDELKNEKNLKRKKQIKTLSIVGIIGIMMICVLTIPVATEVSYKELEEYDVHYTEEVPYDDKKSYTVEVPYTVKVPYKVPVYKTVEHNDPIYDTLNTYELTDSGIDTTVAVIENVYDIERLYTGTDLWGNKEYKYTVYYYNGLDTHGKYYYEKNSAKITDTYQKIIGYNVWSEEVIDYYDTKYKTETRYRTETKQEVTVKFEVVDKVKQDTRYVSKQKTIYPMLYERIMYSNQFR